MHGDVILLYSDPADPVVQTAKLCRPQLPELSFVGYDRLLKHLRPGPWPRMVQSDFPSALRKLFQDAVVINRLFYFDPTIANTALMLEAQHELWLHIAITPLLDTARSLAHDTSVRGVSMSLQPLNLQWFHLSEQSLELPSFIFGFGAEDPDVADLSYPLQKSIWSLFDWKTERHLPQREANWHKFFVDRPTGTPVICHYFAEHFWCSFPWGEMQIDQTELMRIITVIRKTFRSDLGEFLVYREDDGRFRFHAFSPYMTSAVDTPMFSDGLVAWIGQLTKESKTTII